MAGADLTAAGTDGPSIGDMQREYQGPPAGGYGALSLSSDSRRADINGVNASLTLHLIVDLFKQCPACLDAGSNLVGPGRPLRLHGSDPHALGGRHEGAAHRRGLPGMLVLSHLSRDGPDRRRSAYQALSR